MTFIINGTEVDDFFDRVRQIVQEEISNNQHNHSDRQEWGNISFASKILGLSPSTIYQRLDRIPHAKQGGKLFFNRGQLLDYLNDGQRGKGGKL